MAFSPRIFSHKTPGFFLWWGGVLLLSLLLLSLYIVSQHRSKAESARALSLHQRVTVALDGTIEGVAVPPPATATPEPATTTPSAEATPPATPDAAAPPAESTSPAATVAVAPVPTPSITIIITGLGLNQAVLDEAATLPDTISFGFSPYAAESQAQATDATKQGRDVLVELPLESRNTRVDNGPKALLTTASDDANLANLNWALGRVPDIMGIIVPKDEAFSVRAESLAPVVAALAAKKIALIIKGDKESSGWASVLALKQLEGADAEILDEEISPTAIDGKLAEIERLARIHGHVLAVGHAYPVTITRIGAWVEKLEAKGYTLVSPTQFIAAKEMEEKAKKAPPAPPAQAPKE